MDQDHILTGRADVSCQFHHSLGTLGQKYRYTLPNNGSKIHMNEYNTGKKIQEMHETKYMTKEDEQKCIC